MPESYGQLGSLPCYDSSALSMNLSDRLRSPDYLQSRLQELAKAKLKRLPPWKNKPRWASEIVDPCASYPLPKHRYVCSAIANMFRKGIYQSSPAKGFARHRHEGESDNPECMPISLEIWIESARSEEYRPVLSPSLRDRIVHAVVADKLYSIVEPQLLSGAVGFRKGREYQTSEVVKKIRGWIVEGYETFYRSDVRRFDQRVRHASVLAVLEHSVLPHLDPASRQDLLCVVSDHFRRSEEVIGCRGCGLIGGSPLVSVLTNLVLSRVDTILESFGNIRWLRYGDDLLILSREALPASVKPRIGEVLGEMGLELNTDDKEAEGIVRPFHLDDVPQSSDCTLEDLASTIQWHWKGDGLGFDFLGLLFVKNHTLLRAESIGKVKMRHAGVTNYFARRKGRETVDPLELLNEVIKSLCHKLGMEPYGREFNPRFGAVRWLQHVPDDLAYRQCQMMDAYIRGRLTWFFPGMNRVASHEQRRDIGRILYDRGWRGFVFLYHKLHGKPASAASCSDGVDNEAADGTPPAGIEPAGGLV